MTLPQDAPASSSSSSYGDASSSTSSLPSLSKPVRVRRNEQLAVLLPRHLWKPDASASRCDTLACHRAFTVFERRHHCRKCGGIFCHTCSSRTTLLLDTSALPFHHPPTGVPVTNFATEESPVIDARVCDSCFDHIVGPSAPRPNMPRLDTSPSSAVDMQLSSGPSSLCSSIATPPDGQSLLAMGPQTSPRSARTALQARARKSSRTSPSISSVTLPTLLDGQSPVISRDSPAALAPLVSRLSPSIRSASFGELAAYPLKVSSGVCKLTGGGRWEPQPQPDEYMQKLPLCALRIQEGSGLRRSDSVGSCRSERMTRTTFKAPYELDLEKEQQEASRKAANPVIRDGDIQYRFPKAHARRGSRGSAIATF